MIAIPDYGILQKCGHGAYGEVWIARSRTGSLVALKIVEKSEQIAKELAGLRSYSRIADSPYLIRIFHVGEVGDTLYYTMELADNLGTGTLYVPAILAGLLKRKRRFTPGETIELGGKLLSGLAVLHRAGLVHRDIKPENILFVNGEPKLSDIGLVRSVSQSLSLGGTLGFIPPERLKSGSGGKNSADDLYALGKVLYCCLTGNSVEDYPSFPLSLLNDEYSRLNEVILTACNKKTSLRFKTAEEFRDALSNGVSHKKRFRNTAFRMRYWGIGVLAAMFFGSAGIWRHHTAPQQEPVSNPPAVPSQRAAPRQRAARSLQPGVMQSRPEKLDFPPRRSISVSVNGFADRRWKELNASEFKRTSSLLRISPGVSGALRLMIPLDFDYVIRFELNYERLEDLLTFQVYSPPQNTLYQWTLTKQNRRLNLKPLEYQTENSENKIYITPRQQPPDTPGFHRVEMLQTAGIFRLYIDGKLVLSAPSFFSGGYFSIAVPAPGMSNFVEMKNFELLRIPHDPECPPESQYKLPNERSF